MSAGGRARSANLLAVLALVTIAGCTTIALQLVAERNGPKHAEEPRPAEFAAPESSAGIAPLALDHTSSTSTGAGADDAADHHPYRDIYRFQRRPLVDRRFTGQATGRAPLPEEEVSGVQNYAETIPPAVFLTMLSSTSPFYSSSTPQHQQSVKQ